MADGGSGISGGYRRFVECWHGIRCKHGRSCWFKHSNDERAHFDAKVQLAMAEAMRGCTFCARGRCNGWQCADLVRICLRCEEREETAIASSTAANGESGSPETWFFDFLPGIFKPLRSG